MTEKAFPNKVTDAETRVYAAAGIADTSAWHRLFLPFEAGYGSLIGSPELRTWTVRLREGVGFGLSSESPVFDQEWVSTRSFVL